MLIYSGGLRKADVAFDRKTIFVKAGKGKKDRYTVRSDKMVAQMKSYLESYQPAYWPVFIRLGWGREATAFQIFPGWERCAQIAHPLHFLFYRRAFSRQFRQVMVAHVEPFEAALA